ncbi:hypothetical protein [Paeniglutamicibacter sulfureus]|uniref:Uncharacterized protein n=1 Tax=Paeniglutamicibacter sulfureus TaxID=43666 RepID=A0ABU2BMZ3_9MICC|nr:hypothetical protein [Paeniglutamicibacter sulfureus]MDR7360003.1 hypothetical protein [Paeniglutamicibacter sulfureus]
MKARDFLLTQDLDPLRAVPALDEFRIYQVSVGELQARTLLQFPEVGQESGIFPVDRAAGRKPIATAGDITW